MLEFDVAGVALHGVDAAPAAGPGDGVVINAWIGLLGDERESQVIDALIG